MFDQKPRDPIAWSGANPGGRMRLPESEQGRKKKKMNREKTTATLLIAIFMISTLAVAIPVRAQDSERPEVMVSARGHFTTNFDYLGSGVDHSCFINLHARKTAEGWTGQGVFWDRDYEDGKLVAYFTIESTTWDTLPRQVNFIGTADVYVNDAHIGNYVWACIIAIGEPFEIFSFQIQSLPYYAFESGFPSNDVSVKMTVKDYAENFYVVAEMEGPVDLLPVKGVQKFDQEGLLYDIDHDEIGSIALNVSITNLDKVLSGGYARAIVHFVMDFEARSDICGTIVGKIFFIDGVQHVEGTFVGRGSHVKGTVSMLEQDVILFEGMEWQKGSEDE